MIVRMVNVPPAPALPLAIVTDAALSVTLVLPVEFAVNVVAFVLLTEIPPLPADAVRLGVERRFEVVIAPAFAVKVNAVDAVSTLCNVIDPALEVRLTEGAVIPETPFASLILLVAFTVTEFVPDNVPPNETVPVGDAVAVSIVFVADETAPVVVMLPPDIKVKAPLEAVSPLVLMFVLPLTLTMPPVPLTASVPVLLNQAVPVPLRVIVLAAVVSGPVASVF